MKRKVLLFFGVGLMLAFTACGGGRPGSSETAVDGEPGFIALISYFETALEDITGEGVGVSTEEDDWKITPTGLRYVLTSPAVKIGDSKHEVIMKIELTDDSYAEYVVFQLKIDGKNIDL